MSVMTVKAHFDGEKVCLDEPIDLPPNTRVLVTTPQRDKNDPFREEWFAFAKAAFARGYGDDEPDYSDRIGRFPEPE